VALPPKPGGPGTAKPKAGEDALSRSKREKEELETDVQKLEEEIEELKVKYEMYFLGTERREPIRWREEVKKKVMRAKTAFTRNTGLRFKIQSLHARFISYERLWLRSGREKEEGTYRRDLFKARLRSGAASPPVPGATRPPGDAEDVDVSDLAPAPAQRAPAPAAPRPPPPARPPAPPAAVRPGQIGDAQMRELYDAYVSAKRRCNEDVSKLSYEAVSKSVSKQIPELMDRYKARSVDFKVVIKDGKAILKAIPKT
jgi:hypothetical protein